MTIAALLPALALALGSVPPPPLPGQPELLTWVAGAMRCGAAVVRPSAVYPPRPAMVWPGASTVAVTLRFAVDATGRTVDVAREGNDYVAFGDDVAPALVATRFAADAPQRDCRVTYEARRTPVSVAPVDDLIAYSLEPHSGALPPAAWERIGAGGTCTREPRPAPLRRDYPDFEAVAGTAGARDWSMIAYDTDARGRPVKVRVRLGTGNAALDRASIAAVRSSRFTMGARTGCLYPYWRMAQKLEAPAMPAHDLPPPDGATCPSQHGWATPPRLTYPEAYRRRMIEGWAVLAYDVAPWGAIGNVRVLAAQPSADFGTQAIEVLNSARLKSSSTGLAGCVDRVIFRLGAAGDPGNLAPPEGTPPPF